MILLVLVKSCIILGCHLIMYNMFKSLASRYCFIEIVSCGGLRHSEYRCEFVLKTGDQVFFKEF